MKQIAFKFLTALALVALAVGCATNNFLDKENVALAAGFKVITPSTANHLALLKKLTPDKITPIIYQGKPYYVLPDLINNQAYVGGPKQYQSYKELRQKQRMDSENYESTPTAIQVVEVNSMNWGEWGGWGAGGVLGEPGWY